MLTHFKIQRIWHPYLWNYYLILLMISVCGFVLIIWSHKTSAMLENCSTLFGMVKNIGFPITDRLELLFYAIRVRRRYFTEKRDSR